MTLMDIKSLSPQFSTSPQLAIADLPQVAALGYKTVINFRPDGEGGADQPTSLSLAEATQALGMAYVHIPVIPNQIEPAHLEALAQAFTTHGGPILGFCRTGNRANAVYQQYLQSAAIAKPACCGQAQPVGWLDKLGHMLRK